VVVVVVVDSTAGQENVRYKTLQCLNFRKIAQRSTVCSKESTELCADSTSRTAARMLRVTCLKKSSLMTPSQFPTTPHTHPHTTLSRCIGLLNTYRTYSPYWSKGFTQNSAEKRPKMFRLANLSKIAAEFSEMMSQKKTTKNSLSRAN
jgi:hypothetical protein